MTRFPFAPLEHAVGVIVAQRGAMPWDRRSWQSKAYSRAKAEGTLNWHDADRLAIAVGQHPALLWGDLWWEDAEQDEIGELRRRTAQVKYAVKEMRAALVAQAPIGPVQRPVMGFADWLARFEAAFPEPAEVKAARLAALADAWDRPGIPMQRRPAIGLCGSRSAGITAA